ncbi:MAG TPA: hypothetical protein VKA67_12340 [Verrucomicrobiae bacterium]|nr:hypothetical protein [Verrucomicrobiae bacterium]
MKLIADTGLLVAFLNRRDTHYGWAKSLVAEADFPILTCEPVLTETAWHLRDAERLLELVNDDVVRPALDCRDEAEALLRLVRRYADRSPDFAIFRWFAFRSFSRSTQWQRLTGVISPSTGV